MDASETSVSKTPCVSARFENTLCLRSFRKHPVFPLVSKTPCVSARFENTLCLRSNRKHLVFAIDSTTPCVCDRFYNTLCFSPYRKHVVFQLVSKTPCGSAMRVLSRDRLSWVDRRYHYLKNATNLKRYRYFTEQLTPRT